MTSQELDRHPRCFSTRTHLNRTFARMAEFAARYGKKLRPHAKAHKCVQIARRQIAAGAAGVCVATVSEAELMVGGRAFKASC